MQATEEIGRKAERPHRGMLAGEPRQEDLGEIVSLKEMRRAEHFNAAPSAIKNKIIHEQTRSLVLALRYSAFFTIVLSSLSLLVLWPAAPHVFLLGWYASLVTCAVWRHWICVRFDLVQPSGLQLKRWLRWIWLVSFLIGVTWCGLVALVWRAGDMTVFVFVASLLASLAFGTYAAMGQHLNTYLSCAIPQIISLCVLFFHMAGGVSLVAILGVSLIFMAGMIVASFYGQNTWRSVMMLMYKHQDLSRQHREKSTVLTTILHSIGDGVLTVDRNGLVTYLNPAAEHLTGLSLQDVVGHAVAEGFMLTDDAADGQPIDLALVFQQVRDVTHLPGELVLTSISVRAVSVDVTISPLLYSSELEIDGYVVIMRDVTLQRLSVRELSRQASQDSLTGLLNRRAFERRLQEVLLSGSTAHCLCYLDLDHFKVVNDTCGHLAGDELLKQVVSVMQSRIRDSDVLARLGGDEFALLLCGCPIKKAQSIADAICRAVADYRFEWDALQFKIGVSIGLVCMEESDTLMSLTEAADGACYRAKEAGRGGVWVNLRGAAPA